MKTVAEVIKYNRNTLSTVSSFINDHHYNQSPDNYGLPQSVRHLIDLPLNDDLTYVDVIMYLQQYLTPHRAGAVKYVEIGVSVLKTFFQVSNFLSDSELYAFDINDINQTIADKFTKTGEEGSINRYEYNTNKIRHFKGDVFKKEDFVNFQKEINGEVNIIFSDAHHTGEGLKSEYNNYIKGALANDFILYYDDLQNEDMRNVFVEIAKDFKSRSPNNTSALMVVNGWLGQHEFAHVNGIVTSLDLRSHFPTLQYLE
mgnify:CR=1 FL=1